MDIKSFPNNQDEYVGAEWVMRWLHGRTSGVWGADGNAAVSAAGGMNVAVSDGIGWISNDNGDGVVWWNDTYEDTGSPLTLAVPTANASLKRIDRVVVTWPTTDYVALPTITILQGTPASNPVAPALTNNNLQRQISLARITIPAGATSITAAMITDERLDASVCGLVTESISLDTTVIQAQMEALLEEIEEELQSIIGQAIPDHASTHESGGDDEIEVTGDMLSGVLPANVGIKMGTSTPTISDIAEGEIYLKYST